MALVVLTTFGCGEATSTGSGKRIDVGGDLDASSVVGADGAIAPGTGEGRRGMDAGATATGRHPDARAGDGPDVGAAEARARDQGDASDAAMHPDALADAAESVCLPPPNLPPTSMTCTDLPYGAAPESYVVWLADPAAPGHGSAVTILQGGSVAVGAHTYTDGFGLVGGGQHGVFGDAWFDVDGVAKALSFHFEGCAVPVGADVWQLDAAVTRNGSSCTGCPESITRRYVIRRSGSGSNAHYTFDAVGPAQACALGADLLELVLHA